MPSLKILHHTLLFWLLAFFLTLNAARLLDSFHAGDASCIFHVETDTAWLLRPRESGR